MASPIYQAIKQICEEKNIKPESVVETIEAALAAAYRKDFGTKNQNIKVEFNPESGDFRVFDIKTVVADELAAKYEEEKKEREERIKEGLPEEKKEREEKPEEIEGEEELKFNPKLNLSLTEARAQKADAELDEIIKTELEVPGAFGRMAAQTAKQVIIQKLREAERDTLFNEFKGKEGELLQGVVQRFEGKLVLVDLGHVTALLPPEEQIEKEKYTPGTRMKFYLKEVTMTTKGPQIIVSRSHPEILRKLFTFEIPEIASGVVKIRAIAREAGSRSKIAVSTEDENIDPIGSCIGQRGTRIQTIINELSGEKIDIVQWSDNIGELITNALSPAKISSIEVNEAEKSASVQVKADQLSLAIGRGGQNVRLAAKLTGWKINIQGAAAHEGAVAVQDGAAPTEAPAEKPAEIPVETPAEEPTEKPTEAPAETSTKKERKNKKSKTKEAAEEAKPSEEEEVK
ncbi:transcription termination/antitermination protein NusA [Candidatus Falkowbacteria bacterium]|nr:transcription termination/antitermination protein NusA [Candidatus Falkowbacteria bacterium]